MAKYFSPFILIVSTWVMAVVLVGCGDTPEVTQSAIQGPAFVLFFTDNWAPWAAFEPVVNGLEDEYSTQLTFVRLNASDPDNEEIQRGYGLRGHPTVAIIDASGNVEAKFIGEQSAETLQDAIETLLTGN